MTATLLLLLFFRSPVHDIMQDVLYRRTLGSTNRSARCPASWMAFIRTRKGHPWWTTLFIEAGSGRVVFVFLYVNFGISSVRAASGGGKMHSVNKTKCHGDDRGHAGHDSSWARLVHRRIFLKDSQSDMSVGCRPNIEWPHGTCATVPPRVVPLNLRTICN